MISVVITTYNHGDKLATAINSVLQQTYSDIELIIVDDGSNDGTPELLRHYCTSQLRSGQKIKVITTEHLGIGYSRTPGVQAVTGRYLLIMDGDDWIDDLDYLARAVRTLQKDKSLGAYICRKSKYFQEDDTHSPDSVFKFNGKTVNSEFTDVLASEFRPNWIQIVTDTHRLTELHRIHQLTLLEFPMYLMCVFADINQFSYISNQPAVTYRIHNQSFTKNIDSDFILKMHCGTLDLAKKLPAFRSNRIFLINRSKRMFEYYITNTKIPNLIVLGKMAVSLMKVLLVAKRVWSQ